MLRTILGIVCSIILHVSLCAQEPVVVMHPLTVPLDVDEDQLNLVSDWLRAPVHVDSVSLLCNEQAASQEIWYLTDLPHSGVIDARCLHKACTYLKKKNKFKSVTFAVSKLAGKQSLEVEVQSVWLFDKLIVSGPLASKDEYRNYYTLETADYFDIKKHTHCIATIKNALLEQGYLDAKVYDYLAYNDQQKTVSAYITIDTGLCAVIEDVALFVQDEESHIECIGAEHIKKIENRLQNNLVGSFCTQIILTNQENWLRKYAMKNGFFAPKITIEKTESANKESVALQVSILFGPRRVSTFSGNIFFTSKQLQQCILRFDQTAYLMPVSVFVQEIKSMYRRKGFWHCAVDVQEDASSLNFIINEGERVFIEGVRFKGVTLDEKDLLESCFKSLKKKIYFDQEIIDQAVRSLYRYYSNLGFLSMRILKQEYIALNDDTYALEITVDEGLRRYCSSITITQYPELLQSEPFKSIQKKLPALISTAEMDKQYDFLLKYFQDKGYLYVQIKPQLVEAESGTVLSWGVDANHKPTVFGKTIIVGNSTINSNRILKQLPYQEGQLWQSAKLNEMAAKLRELTIFETVHVYPDNIAKSEEVKSVIIKLLEDDPFEIRARLGVQQVSRNLTFRSGSTYKAGGTLLYRNPFNLGDYARFDSDVTRFYRYISALYVCPWAFDLPIHTSLKGYSNKYTQPVRIGINKPLYNAFQQGALIGVTHKFERSFLGVNFGFESMRTSGLSQEYAEAINFKPMLVDKSVPYFFLEPNIFLELLDDKLNPTRGSLTVCAFKGMFSWKEGSVNFFKFLCEQSIFIPLSPLVFGMRVRVGHIFNADLSSIMPPERFFLGGENSLRAYEIDLAPPLGIITEENGKKLLVPQGGRSMVSVNMDLRFPLYKNLGGTIFQDFGVLLEKSLAEITGNKFLGATGFGLRYNTPIGPLRFDIGFKWKRRDPEESSWAWFLTLGNAF